MGSDGIATRGNTGKVPGGAARRQNALTPDTLGLMKLCCNTVQVTVLLMAALHLGGCSASQGPTTFEIAPGQYARAFDAARETLRDQYFSIDRVDYESGVISTLPKESAGLATPWDDDQSTLRQEWEDFAADQRRQVRIVFEHAPGATEPSVGRVTVVIERRYRPGVRVPPKSARTLTLTQDPALGQRAMWPTYEVPIEEDRALASRLAGAISRRLNDVATEPPAQPSQAASSPSASVRGEN